MESKIVKRSAKKSKSLAQRIITLEKKVLKLEKQIFYLKAKETPKEMEHIPNGEIMPTIVAALKKV